MKKFREKKGFSLVEILIVGFIIAVGLTSLLGLSSFSLRIAGVERETIRANALSQEAMEAVRNFRDEIDWNNDDASDQYDGLGVVTTGIAYHPERSSDSPPKWMLIQGQETLGIFTRQIMFEDVSRDASKDIEYEYNPVADDPNTKKVTVTVFWGAKEVEITTYFTNWRE